MPILQELLALNPEYLVLQEGAPPIEISKIITLYPKDKYQAVLERLWGTVNLAWHGKRFFDGYNEHGQAYREAEEAAEEIIKDGDFKAECSMDISGTVDGSDFREELSWESEIIDSLECYLGYDVKADKLYIGFDAWASIDNFTEAFDKTFRGAVGKKFDHENEEHAAIFDDANKQYKEENLGFFGLTFQIDRNMHAVNVLPPMANGFYAGAYRMFKSRHPNVVDLRVD